MAVNFYGGTSESGEHWGTLVPELEKISGEDMRKKRWLTHVLGGRDEPFFKLWKNKDGSLTSEPHLDVDPLYGCVFDDGRSNCVYLHIGHPGRATKLAEHVGPAGCYILLNSHESLAKLPSCLVFHLRAFVQTLVTAQLWVLAKHLHEQECSKVAQLKKYESMYNSLLGPLRSLTEAVRRTQEDAHEIAAIIHDPLDVLLGRQSSIAELFIQDSVVSCTPKGFDVKVKHQPIQYSIKSKEASGVAAELFLRLIPNLVENDSVKDARSSCDVFRAILLVIEGMATSPTNPYNDFTKALRLFLDTKSWPSPLNGLNTWNKIYKCATSSDDLTEAVAVKILESAKERFFTLYKPDQANDPLSWEVLRAYLSTLKPPGSKDFIKIGEDLDGASVVMVGGANPLNTHGHVVAFIGRVAAQHLSYNGQKGNNVEFNFNITQVDDKTVRFTVGSTVQWLPDIHEFRIFLEEQIGNALRGVRAVKENGDLRRPFVDLIQRVPKGVNLASTIEGNTLCLGIGSLSFFFCNNNFCMQSNGGCRRELFLV